MMVNRLDEINSLSRECNTITAPISCSDTILISGTVASSVAGVLTGYDAFIKSKVVNSRSIAFPAIGTGAMGLSYREFGSGFRDGISTYLANTDQRASDTVILVLYDRRNQIEMEVRRALYPE